MSAPTRHEAREWAGRVRGNPVSALIYDPFLWLAERAGMRERRRRILARAEGSVVEIGAGTGLNLAHYPTALSRLVLVEPEKNMAARLRRRLEGTQRPAEVVLAPAEALPFDDDSFDTAVSTMVLCTVEDPALALAEISRVLRPGGTLLFIEHVRSDDPRLARWQDRLHGPWKAFGDGCNCNRPTTELLEAAGYHVEVLERGAWRRMPPLVRPLVAGRASPGP